MRFSISTPQLVEFWILFCSLSVFTKSSVGLLGTIPTGLFCCFIYFEGISVGWTCFSLVDKSKIGIFSILERSLISANCSELELKQSTEIKPTEITATINTISLIEISREGTIRINV